jgi:hypothetical protein
VDIEAFDERDFYRALATCGARVLLIGRRAVIAWGVPVITADYDLWIAADDAATVNGAVVSLDMFPNRTPEEARAVGRYVLENGERVDVLVARSVPTVDGVRVEFEDVWRRREELLVAPDVRIGVPCIDDLILTKRFAARPKDAEDIRLLRALKESQR